MQDHPWMKRGLLAFLASATLLTGCKKPEAVAPAPLLVQACLAQPASRLRSAADTSYIAIIKADTETDLGFKVGGIVDLIGPEPGRDWDEGTPVKAGAVLASLKQADFTNALCSAQAQAELTTKVLDRFRKLRATDAISQQELDVTEASWRSAQAQLAQAEQNLRDSQLCAGTDGVVLSRYVNARSTVGAGQRVLRFADNRVMSVELGLPDRLVSRFVPGKEVPVVISALEGHPPFPGRVSEVGVSASPESRLFRVVIKVPNPEGVLRSGMTASIALEEPAQFAAGSVLVPLSALVTCSATNAAAAPGLAVFVVVGSTVRLQAVQTGDILNSSILVTQGLQAEQWVVTAGASFLYDGAPVRVAEAPSSNN